MDLASPPTALSPAVKHLIGYVGCRGSEDENRDVCLEPDKNLKENQSETRPSTVTDVTECSVHGGKMTFVSSCGGLDLELVASLLPAPDDTAEYFQQAVHVLAPVFSQSQCVLSALSSEQIETTLLPRLQWTQSQQIFRDCLTLLEKQGEEENARNILVLLLVSAVLERALGNLYLLQGQNCPSMLKDLLVTDELTSVLGPSVIQILRAVIGPPISLNLRNVAWHGFLGDQELPRRYCSFLVLLTASIGDVMTGRGVHSIPHRPFFVWSPAVRGKLNTALQIPEWADAMPDLQRLETLLKECLVIQPQTQQQWELVLHSYAQGSYGYCLALLLPLLEHVLRRVFASVNGCPHRVLTAESSALYTTFTEMLEQALPDGSPNQLPEFLTTPCMDLLHDLLVYPEGPRVRDHLSHGEVEFGAVDQAVVVPFFHVVVSLAFRLCPQSSSFSDSDSKAMVGRVQSYRSVFHPVAILQHKFADLLKHLESLDSLPLDSVHRALSGECGEQRPQCDDNPLLTQTREKVVPLWQCQSLPSVCHVTSHDSSNGLSLQLEALKRISHQHIPTLFRWQAEAQAERGGRMKESEFVGLLGRMTEECSTAVQQVQQTLQQRHQQLSTKQLRSRQRDNLKKLLLCIPCLQILVSAVSAIIGWSIQRLPDFASLTFVQCKMLQKFLKQCLQQCENLRTLTSQDRNKWTESVDLLLLWIPTCQQFLLSWHQQAP